ncbi:unnamed protein product [Paramecium pentaurelia]|uniref:Uncharacterized protein n=1 Tax=Paramecium pentaurelia TaxID=43138 RepID=A0A8S1T1B6_9CILI|nr:unnamed protein product [Paramecium pentaurelia]
MIFSGSLRTTTPEQKSQIRTKKHFDLKHDLDDQLLSLKYLNNQKIIQCIKTKKHIQPIITDQNVNISKLRRSISPLQNSQLDRSLVPKIDTSPKTPQKSRLYANLFNNTCSFENICLTQCNHCKSNNKENLRIQTSPIKMTQSIFKIEPQTCITSRGNYFKK